MKVTFTGGSDDLVEIDGDVPMLNGPDKGSGRAEWGVDADRKLVPFHIVGAIEKCSECGKLKDPVHIATVFAYYDGFWGFLFSPAFKDGDMPVIPPGWTLTITAEHISAALNIDTGDGQIAIMAPWYEGDDD
jgi:hypothetical protein